MAEQSETKANSIRKLTGDNYATWSYQIKLVLMECDLWTVIDPGEAKPEENDAEKLRRYVSRQGKTLAKICLSIGDEQQQHIHHLESPKAVWEELERLYAPRDSKFRIIQLRRKLYSMKLTEHANMNAYLGNINHTVTELANIGDKIDDGDLAMVALCGLPEEWDTVVSAICNLPADEFTSATVKRRLLAETERKGTNEWTKSANALVAKGTHSRTVNDQLYMKEKVANRTEIRCYHCGKRGHLIRECRLKQRDKNNSKPLPKRNVPFKSKGSDLLMMCNGYEGNLSIHSWIVDSGATHHMTPDATYFSEWDGNKCDIDKVAIADGSSTPTNGKGTVHARLSNNKGTLNAFTAKDVILVPDIKHSVLSVSQMTKNEKTVVFTNQGCSIYDKEGNKLITAKKQGRLFVVKTTPGDMNTPTAGNYLTTAHKRDQSHSLALWHSRLMHVNKDTVLKMSQREAVRGLFLLDSTMTECDACLQGKSTRQPFMKQMNTDTIRMPLELVYSDLMGPIDTPSWGGARYVLTITDEASRYVQVFFLKTKDEALTTFREWLRNAEKQSGRKLKRIRTDNGLEFCSAAWDKLCKELGIIHETTMVYTPQQNGIAERLNRTLMDLVRSTICATGLPKASWAELVNTAAYIRNRTINTHNQDQTPFELWHQRRPSIKHLRVIGCKVFVHIQKQRQRSKLDARAKEGILIGYPKYSKGWRIWLPDENKVVETRDCKFLENQVGKISNSSELPYVVSYPSNDKDDQTSEENDISELEIPETSCPATGTREPLRGNLSQEITQRTEQYSEKRKKATRQGNHAESPQKHPMQLRKLPSREASTKERDDVNTPNKAETSEICLALASGDCPSNYDEAIQSQEAAKWLYAMEEEMESMKKHQVWELTKLPQGVKPIDSRWVFTKKSNADGHIIQYKARLVAKGFSQTKGVNFEEIYSPVSSFEATRLITAVAAEKKWTLEHYDIKSAYLHGELDHVIYMEQPKGFVQSGKEQLYCKLQKSLYGLKQSGRCWNVRLDSVLQSSGFSRSKTEPCVYSINTKLGSAILSVYVDDFLVASENQRIRKHVQKILMDNFECKYLGPVDSLLGVKFSHHEDGSISLTQEVYINHLLKRFGLEDAKGFPTPMETRPDFSNDCARDGKQTFPYLELVGALLYLSQRTRPDIAFAVNRLAQFCSDYRETHWKAAKRVLRYLKETSHLGITYKNTGEELKAYSDADWGTCHITRKSTSGYAIILGGAPIFWKSTKQSAVALSSMEAEYMALSLCTRDITWIRTLLEELHLGEFITGPTIIYSDNQAAIAHSEKQITKCRTKHIAIQYHYVRDKVESKVVTPKYISSAQNMADVLTKPLGREKHCEQVRMLLDQSV